MTVYTQMKDSLCDQLNSPGAFCHWLWSQKQLIGFHLSFVDSFSIFLLKLLTAGTEDTVWQYLVFVFLQNTDTTLLAACYYSLHFFIIHIIRNHYLLQQQVCCSSIHRESKSRPKHIFQKQHVLGKFCCQNSAVTVLVWVWNLTSDWHGLIQEKCQESL